MWIIPSRGRRSNLVRFFKESQPMTRTLVILDDDDAENYAPLHFPPHVIVRIWPRARLGEHYRRAFEQFPNEDYYAFGADDILPVHGFDMLLERAGNKRVVIWGHDGDKGNCTHPWVGGDLVRAAGFLAVPGLQHFYIDNFWNEVAVRMRRGGLVPHVQLNHLHFTNGKAPMDETYKNRPSSADDKAVYDTFMAKEFSAIMGRIRCLM